MPQLHSLCVTVLAWLAWPDVTEGDRLRVVTRATAGW